MSLEGPSELGSAEHRSSRTRDRPKPHRRSSVDPQGRRGGRQKKNDAVEYSAALHLLRNYYEYAAGYWGPDPARIWHLPKEVVQKLNARAIGWQKAADDILDVALKAAEASHADCWTGWADTAVRRAKAIKDPKARYDMLQRILRTMSWVGYVPRAVHTEAGTGLLPTRALGGGGEIAPLPGRSPARGPRVLCA